MLDKGRLRADSERGRRNRRVCVEKEMRRKSKIEREKERKREREKERKREREKERKREREKERKREREKERENIQLTSSLR